MGPSEGGGQIEVLFSYRFHNLTLRVFSKKELK